MIDELSNKEEWKSFGRDMKVLLTETIAFPLMTTMARFPLVDYSDPSLHNYYAAITLAADITEIIYRVYMTDEIDKLGGDDCARKPYSCFEKHVFYDAPRFLYGKVFGGGDDD